MKRIITAVAALLLSVATFAQTNDNPPPAGQPTPAARATRTPMTPQQKAKRETDKINALTPLGDTYDKVLEVNIQTEIKRETIANGAKRNEFTEDQKAQIKALNEAHRKNLETAMGKELYEKWKAAEKAKREEKRNQGATAPQGQGK